MARLKPAKDPKGHSLRIYSDVFDSAAYGALSPHDCVAYLALLRELKGGNNGDLSLTLTVARKRGISHHVTLARSLRALCAVGLVALSRKGGCTKGGQRLPNLYRITDRVCYDIPAKVLYAMPETNEWRKVKSIEEGLALIEKGEQEVKAAHAKKKNAGHGVTPTRTQDDVVKPKTRTPRDISHSQPGHGVTVVGNAEGPVSIEDSGGFDASVENGSHRTPHVPPLYLCHTQGAIEAHGTHLEQERSRPDLAESAA